MTLRFYLEWAYLKRMVIWVQFHSIFISISPPQSNLRCIYMYILLVSWEIAWCKSNLTLHVLEVRLHYTPRIFSICREKKKCKIKIVTAHSHCSCQNTVLGGQMAPNGALHYHGHVGATVCYLKITPVMPVIK